MPHIPGVWTDLAPEDMEQALHGHDGGTSRVSF